MSKRLALASAEDADAFIASAQEAWPGLARHVTGPACLPGTQPAGQRPMVASVVPPEQRCRAFAIFLTNFETIDWAAFTLGAGQFAASVGL